ncbi:Lcl C-terminal domain-containing protein [Kaarinaea lacus]
MNHRYIKITIFIALIFFANLVAQGQECNNNMPVVTPTDRFEDQGNGIVLDRNTRLVWKKCAEGQVYNSLSGSCNGDARMFVSNEALAFEANINTTGFAGYTDWRVPNIKELSSIVEPSCVNPAINIVVFRNTPNGFFRSSTPSIGGFYCVNFGNGMVSQNCDITGTGGGGGMGGGGMGADTSEGYLRFVRN